MTRFRATAFGLLTASHISLSVHAAPIVFDFTATVRQETSSTAATEFETATGLNATAFDLGDMFTGQVAIDLSRAGVDTSTETFANPSDGGPPLLPPFLEISISDGVNSASPLTVPFASTSSDADQFVSIFMDTLILRQDVTVLTDFRDFRFVLNIEGVAGLTVLDDLISGADFSSSTSIQSSFAYQISGGSFARSIDFTSFTRAASVSPVPVPATAPLFLAGFGVLAASRRRRRTVSVVSEK
ncbi:MAG: VPLPA-CTERM sorting domain-containing protein [Pseudomonadota bacterium]